MYLLYPSRPLVAAKPAEVAAQVLLRRQGQQYRTGPPGLVLGPSQGQGMGLSWRPFMRTLWQVALASLEYAS